MLNEYEESCRQSSKRQRYFVQELQVFLGSTTCIDLLAILQKRLDLALFLYIFIRDVRSSGVRASISIVQFRKFDKM